MHNKHFYAAIATLVGTIIGAGVLGIPYVISQAGFITGLVNLVILGVAVLLLYLFVGEVVLRTRGNHQLTGYAEIYLENSLLGAIGEIHPRILRNWKIKMPVALLEINLEGIFERIK